MDSLSSGQLTMEPRLSSTTHGCSLGQGSWIGRTRDPGNRHSHLVSALPRRGPAARGNLPLGLEELRLGQGCLPMTTESKWKQSGCGRGRRTQLPMTLADPPRALDSGQRPSIQARRESLAPRNPRPGEGRGVSCLSLWLQRCLGIIKSNPLISQSKLLGPREGKEFVHCHWEYQWRRLPVLGSV